MSYILFVFFAASAWCFGFHMVMHVFFDEVLGIDLNARWDEFHRSVKLLYKPIFACPYCMASVHGSLIYFLYLSHYGLFFWPVFCVCLCGFNYLLSQFINE